MEITANQTFLHGHDRYEEGETYDVPEGLATYFVMAGWADSDDLAAPGHAPSEEVTLDVHSSTHDHGVTTNG